MKANELAVGDWIMWNNKVIEVDTLWRGSHTAKVSLFGGERFQDVFLTDVKPITITKEILEKIGFLDLSQTRGNVLEVDDKYINYDLNNGYLFIIGRDEDLIDVRNIRFVHELQHVLRLCKIDKEIEL